MAEYRDPSPVSPKIPEYSIINLNPEIKKYSDFIRTKMYGEAVRESLARGLEISGQESGLSLFNSNVALAKVNNIQKQFDVIVNGLTNDSEVKIARISKSGKTHNLLGYRLDEIEERLMTRPVQSVSDNTIKLLDYQDINNIKVYTQTLGIGSALEFTFKAKSGDTGNTSVGTSWDLLRLIKVRSLEQLFSFYQPNNFKTSEIDGQKQFKLNNFDTGYYFPTNLPYISNTGNEKYGAFFEFDIEVTPANQDRMFFGFFGTAASNTATEIYLNGNLIKTFNTRFPDRGIVKTSIPLNGFLGKATIKIAAKNDATSNGAIHFLGVNCIDLKDISGEIPITGYLYNILENGGYITRSTGANDYAFLDKNLNKWAGSFHGGEIREMINITCDGIEISGNNSSCLLFKSLSILQQTKIKTREVITTFSETRIDAAAKCYFKSEMKSENENKLSDTYIAMNCTDPDFSEIIDPKRSSVSKEKPSETILNAFSVTQATRDLSKRIKTEIDQPVFYYNNTPLRVLFFEGLYSKVYHALNLGEEILIKDFIASSLKTFY